MKGKKLVFNALATVGMILLILPMFLAMYSTTVSAGGSTSDPTFYKIFNDWSGFTDVYKLAGETFSSVWALITDIIAVVLLVLAALYVILFILQLLKVGGKKVNYSKFMKLLALLIIILTLVAVVTGIIFIAANALTHNVPLVGQTKYAFGFGIGAIMLLVGGVLTGTFGLIANSKK